MKRILALSILFFTIPALALAGSTVTLPDYEKEGKVTLIEICDKGDTTITTYGTDTYYLEVAKMKSGKIFFFFDDKNTGIHTYAKDNLSTDMVELSMREWMQKVKEASLNYYNVGTRSDKTDCVTQKAK